MPIINNCYIFPLLIAFFLCPLVVKPSPIRGVNLGGWLVLERWIKPSMMESCMVVPANLNPDCFWGEVPLDQWTYCEKLKVIGEQQGQGNDILLKRLRRHWDTWVTKHNIKTIGRAGITHLRIPIGHWICGGVQEGEPYIGGELPYLIRVLRWAREYNLQVWLDLHTAPKSQNGFDNSGHLGNISWGLDAESVMATVESVSRISLAMAQAGFADVVTGFGVLNEPGPFVKVGLLENYYEDAYAAVRANLPNATVYIGDGFNSANFNNFWTGGLHSDDPRKLRSVYTASYPTSTKANEVFIDQSQIASDQQLTLSGRSAFYQVDNVALDTHLYHCFTKEMRAFSPKQHIQEVCGKDHAWLEHCCDGKNKTGSKLARMVGEWTAAYDQEPGLALEGHGARHLSAARIDFLSNYVKAQVVMYEDAKTESPLLGWFFWNFKMEVNVYEEWDFLYGLEKGWIPHFKHGVSATDMFGSCEQILENTDDNLALIDPFPPDSWYSHHQDPKQRTQEEVFDLKMAGSLLPLVCLFWTFWIWSFKRRYTVRQTDESSNTPVSSHVSLSSQQHTTIQYGSIVEMGSIPQREEYVLANNART